MEQLLKRGEELANDAEQAKVREIADRLTELLGGTVVDGSRVTASGRGLMRQWFMDPRLRFLWDEIK